MKTHYLIILSLLLSGTPVINAQSKHHASCSDCPDKEEKDKTQKRSVPVQDENAADESQAEAAEAKCGCNAPVASGKPLVKDASTDAQQDQAKCSCNIKPLPKPPRANAPEGETSEAQISEIAEPAVVAIVEKCALHHHEKECMNPSCSDCPKEPKDQN